MCHSHKLQQPAILDPNAHTHPYLLHYECNAVLCLLLHRVLLCRAILISAFTLPRFSFCLLLPAISFRLSSLPLSLSVPLTLFYISVCPCLAMYLLIYTLERVSFLLATHKHACSFSFSSSIFPFPIERAKKGTSASSCFSIFRFNC